MFGSARLMIHDRCWAISGAKGGTTGDFRLHLKWRMDGAILHICLRGGISGKDYKWRIHLVLVCTLETRPEFHW